MCTGPILAAKDGATYVSPFVGRLDDNSIAGLEVVRSISEIFRIHGIRTQVLSFYSHRTALGVRSWYNGAEVVTMLPKVFEDMYNHVLTDKGLEIFDNDWKRSSNLDDQEITVNMDGGVGGSWKVTSKSGQEEKDLTDEYLSMYTTHNDAS